MTAATKDRPKDATVGDCLALASEWCATARGHEFDGSLKAARTCYLRAEVWLDKAAEIRGTYEADGPAVLDARLAVERRMGLAN